MHTHKKQKKEILQRTCDSKYKTVRLFLPKREGKGQGHWNGQALEQFPAQGSDEITIPGSVQNMCMWHLGNWLSGEWLDLIILKVFYNFNDSVTLKGK